MKPEELINYGSLVQEVMGEYRNIVTPKRWEPTDIKEKSEDYPFPMNVSTG